MDAIKEWMVILGIVLGVITSFSTVVVWLVRIDGRVSRNTESHNRLENRVAKFEASHHDQAIQLARIEAYQSNIKETVDRIYSQISSHGEIQHHTGKTVPPGRMR